MRYSLGILKPDCLQRELTPEVLRYVEASGLSLVTGKKMRLTGEQVDQIYSLYLTHDFYPGFREFMLSGDVYVYIVEGDNAIDTLNKLVGDTDPKEAAPKTIRNLFGESAQRNVTHSTRDLRSLLFELKLLFTEQEIREAIQNCTFAANPTQIF